MDRANIKRKKKYGRLRAAALLSVYILMGIHIAHWLLVGQTLAPLELNEVLYTLHLGVITAGFIFMGITMIGTIFFGRFFCSWACHILALQDLSEWILEKFKFRPQKIRSRIFLFVPVIAMLYLFVWPQITRAISGIQLPELHIETDANGWASFITKDFWRNLPSIPVTLFTFFTCGFAVIYLLGTRSFCQAICPYGVLFAAADKFAPGKIKLTGSCNQCGICTAHCSSHILVHKEIDQFGKVVSSNCLKDLDCVAVCPNDAISYGFTKPSFLDSFRRIKGVTQHYNFSLKEDIAMAAFILIYVVIFRGLYDMVPFLLAITLAVIFSYFTIVFSRLFLSSFVQMGKYVFRRNARMTTQGKYFSTGMIVILLFTFHSAFVHYHQYRGDLEYNRVLKMSGNHQINLNESGITALLRSALNHLERSAQWGLFSPLSQNRQLASIYLAEKDYAKAEVYLVKMLEQAPDDIEARVRLAKLMFVSGREAECLTELRRIIETPEESISESSKLAKSDALLTFGHIEEKNGFFSQALDYYEKALNYQPDNPETMLALGMIYTKAGRLTDAEKFLVKCNERMPGSPLIHNNLSMIYLKTGNSDLAMQHLSILLDLQPNNFQALYNLGMLLYKKGRVEESIQCLERVIQINPTHVNAHLGLGNILEITGEKDSAAYYRTRGTQLKLHAGEPK